MIDSSPPHGFSPFGHGTFMPVQTTYKPSVVLLILDLGEEGLKRRGAKVAEVERFWILDPSSPSAMPGQVLDFGLGEEALDERRRDGAEWQLGWGLDGAMLWV